MADTSETVLNRIQIDINSTVAMAEFVEIAFGRVSCGAGMDKSTSLEMAGAIRELVLNAMRHGNELNPTKRVVVDIKCEGDHISVSIQDEGKVLDPTLMSDLFSGKNLIDSRKTGVSLVKEFVDDIDYSFDPSFGTKVTITKRSDTN